MESLADVLYAINNTAEHNQSVLLNVNLHQCCCKCRLHTPALPVVQHVADMYKAVDAAAATV